MCVFFSSFAQKIMQRDESFSNKREYVRISGIEHFPVVFRTQTARSVYASTKTKGVKKKVKGNIYIYKVPLDCW